MSTKLDDLIARGARLARCRLFVIDGSKALRCEIRGVFGPDNPVQRCRKHKVRNVTDNVPKDLKEQVKSAMRAAYRLEPSEGMARLEQQARRLEKEYPGRRGDLCQGLAGTFTVNRISLPGTLRRCLCVRDSDAHSPSKSLA